MMERSRSTSQVTEQCEGNIITDTLVASPCSTAQGQANMLPKAMVFVHVVNPQTSNVEMKSAISNTCQTPDIKQIPVKIMNINDIATQRIMKRQINPVKKPVSTIIPNTPRNIVVLNTNETGVHKKMVQVSTGINTGLGPANGSNRPIITTALQLESSQIVQNQFVGLPIMFVQSQTTSPQKLPQTILSPTVEFSSSLSTNSFGAGCINSTVGVGVNEDKSSGCLQSIKTEKQLDEIDELAETSVYANTDLHGLPRESVIVVPSAEHIPVASIPSYATERSNDKTQITLSTTDSVKVETVNQCIPEFQCEYSGNQVHCYQEIPNEGYMDGHGPDFIAEETEVIAGEAVTTDGGIMVADIDAMTGDSILEIPENMVHVIVPNSGQSTLEGNIIHIEESFLSMSNEEGVVQMVASSGLDELLIVPDDRTPSDVITVTVSDTETGRTTDPEVKSSLKRTKDREMKRWKRADPEYRKMERQKALIRMRNRRTNQEYRESERERDRKRRNTSRHHNPVKRNEEREKDKMYKRLRRIRMLQNPMMGTGDMSEEFVSHVESEERVVEEAAAVMELGGQVAIMDNNILDCLV